MVNEAIEASERVFTRSEWTNKKSKNKMRVGIMLNARWK